jgi:hypothetical protein
LSEPSKEPQSLTFILPWPPRALSPNGGCRFGLKIKAKADYRDLCTVLVHNAWVESSCKSKPRWRSACYRIRALCGKKHQRKGKNGFVGLNHPDEDNFLASLKNAFDALQIVGIIHNDKHLRIDRAVEWIRTEAKDSFVELAVWNISPTEKGKNESLSRQTG